MANPIIFSRTIALGGAGASLTLSSIPQTANHLMFRVRARSSNDATAGNHLALRPNASAEAASYDGNTQVFSTASAGQADDGIDLTRHILGNLTHNTAPAGVFNEHWGMIPRYALAEHHVIMSLGFGRAAAADNNAANFETCLSGGSWRPATPTAITSLQILAEIGNIDVGSEITVWGLLDTATASSVKRSAGSLAVDFAGDEFKTLTLTAGDNAFTMTNPALGRVITYVLSGGNGTTTITLPATVKMLEENYVPGQPAFMFLRCVDEIAPEYVATIKNVVSAGGTF